MPSSAMPSRSPSRPRAPDSILPDGEVGEEAAELLHEFIHPHAHPAHAIEETIDHDGTLESEAEEEADRVALEFERTERASRPRWRRPTAWWFLASVPFSMIAFAATLAPKIEILTEIVCRGQGEAWDPETMPSANGQPIPCAKNPRVEATVTAILTVIALITGILSCLTAAWWGSLSDRFGRIFVLRLNVLSLVIGDVIFILVYFFHKSIPGGYWALLLPPIVDGLLGARMASSAAMHAYMADCSDAATRSRIFSQFLGFVFIGLAIGPALGSLIARWTQQAIATFYFATVVHVIYAILVGIIIPESLLPTQMRAFRRRHAASIAEIRAKGGLFLPIKRLFSFLSPLAMFFPAHIENTGSSPRGTKSHRDWSLTLLAMAYMPETLLLGSSSVIFQFASATYGWSTEMLGYWISIVGATRAIFLAIILPAILTLFRTTPAIELPTSPSEPLITDSTSSPRARSPRPARPKHIPKLDLAVARSSLVVVFAACLIQASSPPTWGFIFATVLASFGSGFTPTVQSLAMELYRHQGGHETGKLFGALSVLSSLGTSIIGPFLYGLIYIRTVATFPATIFFVSAIAVLLSFALLFFVRLPVGLGTHGQTRDREETRVDR